MHERSRREGVSHFIGERGSRAAGNVWLPRGGAADAWGDPARGRRGAPEHAGP